MVTAYVDGSGGESSGYGYYIPETGESEYAKKPNLTNMQAEYMAVLSVLDKFAGSAEPLTVYSDSQVVVRQINHEYGINNEALRGLAQKAWRLLSSYTDARVVWIQRKKNLAGKMLGS